MFDVNISRDEAKDRSTRITARSYEVTVDLSGRAPDGAPLADSEATFVTTSTVHFHSTGGDDTINIIADEVWRAELDGQPIDTDLTDYRLPFQAAEGEHTLTVQALGRYSRTGEGLHRFVDPADDKVYLYTQFETADARRMYACFEQPDQKATFTFTVIAPEHWAVLSNSPSPVPEPIGDGFARFAFAETQRMSPYITALIAGDYHCIEDSVTSTSGDEIPMALVCRQSLVDHLDAERIFTITKQGFAVLEDAFGYPYPFGKYDQAFVPEYNAGAMENAGMVTIRDEYLFRSRVTAAAMEGRDNTILHELTHMWFGDLVTMTWWDDLWLNESFAEWGSHFAQEKITERFDVDLSPWATFANQRKNWAYRQDQLPTTHPIAADMVDLETVELNFDGITYAKGASVLKLLVSFVGEDAFLSGVRTYFDRNAFGNTELRDLLTELEAASGRDLSWFTGEWLEKAGVNTLRADFDVDEDGRFTRFDVIQTAVEEWPTLRTHRLAIGLYAVDGTALSRKRRVELDISGERTSVDELIGKKRHDLILLNDDDLTYAKVRLDTDSLATLVAHIDKLDSKLTRALSWGAAWDMLRDAEMSAADYIALVVRGAATETDATALGSITQQAVTALDMYAPDDARESIRAELTGGFARLLKAAEPGSDAQLVFAKALAQVSRGDAAEALFRGWLAGEEVPDGLAIDTDMRWSLLLTLARMGRIDDAEITAETERDNSITGREWAALIRAARPDEASKAEAWRVAVEDPDTPNETQRKVAMAFHQPDQSGVIGGFVDRYFAMVDDIAHDRSGWDKRSPQIAQMAVSLMFPRYEINRDFLARVDEFLGSTDLTTAIQRQVVERRADLERALRVREAD